MILRVLLRPEVTLFGIEDHKRVLVYSRLLIAHVYNSQCLWGRKCEPEMNCMELISSLSGCHESRFTFSICEHG